MKKNHVLAFVRTLWLSGGVAGMILFNQLQSSDPRLAVFFFIGSIIIFYYRDIVSQHNS